MLRFTSALQVQALPDEQLDDRFEVIMPSLNINNYQDLDKDAGATSTTTEKKSIWSEGLEKLTSSDTWSNFTGIKYTPIVEEIVFGTMNFKTDTRRIRTGWYNIPTDIENYKEVSITMFCSAGMLTQYYLETWKRMVFNPYGEYYNPGSFYKKNIEIFFEGLASAPSFDLIGGGDTWQHSMHVTLVGCFPSMQDSYKLSYSADPKRLRLTQKFKVDKVLFDMTKGKIQVAARTDLLGSSGSNLVDSFSSTLAATANSTYDIQEVYNATAGQKRSFFDNDDLLELKK